MSNHSAAITYETCGSGALAPSPARRLVLIEGGAARTLQAPATYHEQATGLRNRVVSTARGVLAFCMALSLFLVIAWVGIARDASIDEHRAEVSASVSLEEVVVQQGDSLWQLAEEHPIEGLTTAESVSYIREVNGLTGSALGVGQRLLVPAT